MLGITCERVRQIEAAALTALRAPLGALAPDGEGNEDE